jgi:hypothetical protein
MSSLSTAAQLFKTLINMGLLQQMDPHFREYPSRNTATINIIQDGTNRRLEFPKSCPAEDKHIFGISLRRKGSAGKANNGSPLCTDAAVDGSFITIRSGQSDTLRDCPLAYLTNKADGSEPGKYMQVSMPGGFVPNSSFIQIADGVTLTANDVFEITFHYLFPDDCNGNPL